MMTNQATASTVNSAVTGHYNWTLSAVDYIVRTERQQISKPLTPCIMAEHEQGR